MASTTTRSSPCSPSPSPTRWVPDRLSTTGTKRCELRESRGPSSHKSTNSSPTSSSQPAVTPPPHGTCRDQRPAGDRHQSHGGTTPTIGCNISWHRPACQPWSGAHRRMDRCGSRPEPVASHAVGDGRPWCSRSAGAASGVSHRRITGNAGRPPMSGDRRARGRARRRGPTLAPVRPARVPRLRRCARHATGRRSHRFPRDQLR